MDCWIKRLKDFVQRPMAEKRLLRSTPNGNIYWFDRHSIVNLYNYFDSKSNNNLVPHCQSSLASQINYIKFESICSVPLFLQNQAKDGKGNTFTQRLIMMPLGMVSLHIAISRSSAQNFRHYIPVHQSLLHSTLNR